MANEKKTNKRKKKKQEKKKPTFTYVYISIPEFRLYLLRKLADRPIPQRRKNPPFRDNSRFLPGCYASHYALEKEIALEALA